MLADVRLIVKRNRKNIKLILATPDKKNKFGQNRRGNRPIDFLTDPIVDGKWNDWNIIGALNKRIEEPDELPTGALFESIENRQDRICVR